MREASQATEIRCGSGEGEQNRKEKKGLCFTWGKIKSFWTKAFEKPDSPVFSPFPTSAAFQGLKRAQLPANLEEEEEHARWKRTGKREKRRTSYRGQDPEVIPAHVTQLGHIHLPHGGPGPRPEACFNKGTTLGKRALRLLPRLTAAGRLAPAQLILQVLVTKKRYLSHWLGGNKTSSESYEAYSTEQSRVLFCKVILLCGLVGGP